MQIQQLVYFVEVAKQGSINRAAEKLFITQPSLSKAILNLENELKVSVFERTNRGVLLTVEGRKLYQYAHSIITQLELIEGLADREVPQTLSIASYPILTMGRLVGAFYNRHLGEKLQLRLMEQRLQEVLSAVAAGGADLGFIMYNSAQEKEIKSTLRYKKLEFIPLGIDTWYANMGPNNPLYKEQIVTMEQLKQYSFVRRPDDYFSNLSFYLEIDGMPIQEIRQVIYINDSADILAVLRQTSAFRFGPGISKTDFEAFGIHTIPIQNCNVKINVGWVRRKREELSEAAKEFVKDLEMLYPQK